MPSIRELNGVLNRIGNFNPTQFEQDFDNRLILQKTIYLLQAFGLNVGYSFNWYLRGPYSPDLSRTTYLVASNYDPEASAQFCDEKSEKRFCEFLAFIGTKKNDQVWLETVASIHFLANLYGEKNEAEVYARVSRKMGQLSRQRFVEAWNYLCRTGLLSTTIS